MNCTVNTNDLREGITTVRRPLTCGTYSSKGAAAIRLTATDEDRLTLETQSGMTRTAIIAHVPATVAEMGNTYIADAGAFERLIKSLPKNSEITIDTENMQVTYNCERVHGAMRQANPDALHWRQSYDGMFDSSVRVELDGAAMWRLINGSRYAIATNDERPALQNVLFEARSGELTTVGCDGCRVATATESAQFSGEATALIPGAVCAEVERITKRYGDTVSLEIARDYALFTVGNVEIVSGLRSDNYPDCRKYIPQSCAYTLQLDDTADMLAALKRSLIITQCDEHKRVTLSHNYGETGAMMVCTEGHDGFVNEDIPARLFFDSFFDVCVNPNFLIETLSSIPAHSPVRIGYNTDTSPILIEAGSQRAIILPILRDHTAAA